MKKGFTLIELFGSLILLAIIATITIPVIIGAIDSSKEKTNIANVNTLILAAKDYHGLNLLNPQAYPIDEDESILNFLSFSGTEPDEATHTGYGIYVNSAGRVAVALQYDDRCYTKSFVSETITGTTSANILECVIPS